MSQESTRLNGLVPKKNAGCLRRAWDVIGMEWFPYMGIATQGETVIYHGVLAAVIFLLGYACVAVIPRIITSTVEIMAAITH